MRDCTDRQCGNNPRRKVNPNDYDSVMGFLCDACEDARVAEEQERREQEDIERREEEAMIAAEERGA